MLVICFILGLRKLLKQNKSIIYERMLKMFQERIYEEPVRFFGSDIPKQIQEYRKQRLQQFVECECGETFLMKDATNHMESDYHISFKEEDRRRKELEEHLRIENDTGSEDESDNYSDDDGTKRMLDLKKH